MRNILLPAVSFLVSVSAYAQSPQFKDVTTLAGLSKMASTTVNVGDFNDDGKPDLLVAGRLFQNDSTRAQIHFLDVSKQMGFQEIIAGYPLFVDLNNDGHLDIVTTERRVFLQKDHKFIDVTSSFGDRLPEFINALSYADINGDGFADILIGPSEITDNNQFNFRPIQIMINQKGLGFINATRLYQSDRFLGYVRGFAWADFDNSGSAKAYFSNYRLRPNFLFKFGIDSVADLAVQKNIQGIYDQKMFDDPYRKTKVGYNYGHTLGSAWVDFDNDGNFDLWVSNLVHKFVDASDIRGYLCDDSKIYRNTGAPGYNFVDMRKNSGIPFKPIGDWSVYKGDELWTHSTSADFDNDGLVDMYVTQVYNLPYAYSLLFKNKGNFKFDEVSAQNHIRVIDSYAGAWADFDGDGKVDLVTSGRSRVDAEPELHIQKNVSPNQNHFLKIKLIGKASGRNPVTTQVRVFHAKGLFLRQFEGVVGSLNQQNDSVLHFGLGQVTKLEKIEIRWNSGKRQVLTSVLPDQTLTVIEPD